jgi:hypothetical protein
MNDKMLTATLSGDEFEASARLFPIEDLHDAVYSSFTGGRQGGDQDNDK